ncbi:BnaC09g21400D [Brassica napus]|uniref:BnaC09g21400D protein n=1 Tax=Brassica napus TaxID=3708 RepID=A0A078I452_BRANA|nr:BnaC09g21400D [Brassica napus]
MKSIVLLNIVSLVDKL